MSCHYNHNWSKGVVAQPQHLSRHVAPVPLRLNRIFIEVFIETNNCLYCYMHCVMMFCNKSGAPPCRFHPAAEKLGGKMEKEIPAMGIMA